MTSQAAALLVELALKSTVVLGVAFALAAALRRFSSEERHVVFAVALVGLLVLPLLTIFGPAVELPVPGTAAPEATAAASTEPGVAEAPPGPGNLAPGVKAPDSSLRPLPSRSRTPSTPSRSSLSMARSTTSFCAGSATPDRVRSPSSNLRLLIFTTAEPCGRPAASRPSTAMAMTSASASGRSEPTVSASHWTNSRKRPGPGFSLRQTEPKA